MLQQENTRFERPSLLADVHTSGHQGASRSDRHIPCQQPLPGEEQTQTHSIWGGKEARVLAPGWPGKSQGRRFET